MKIISFTLKQSGWLESKPTTTTQDCKKPNLQLQIGIFRNLQLYFSLSGSLSTHRSLFQLCTHSFRNSDGHQ